MELTTFEKQFAEIEDACALAQAIDSAILAMERRIVAVVEDDPSVLKGLERILSAAGFVAEVYTSAEAFLECAATSRANCLVLDIHLRGVSGFELQRRLAAAGSCFPVIFMTASDNEITQREAIAAKCIAYLHKPFTVRQLIEAIGKVASSQLGTIHACPGRLG